MKYHHFGLCALTFLCVAALAASAGWLAAGQHLPEQNRLGGTGSISLLNADSVHLNGISFRDQDNVYFTVYTSSGSGSALQLCACHLKSGRTEPVCRKITCTHQTSACALYPLYRSMSPENHLAVLNFCVADDLIFYTVRKGDLLCFYQWDPLTDRHRHLADYPAFTEIQDENGRTVRVDGELDKVIRLNAERIMVLCTDTMYIYDNDYQELVQIPVGSAHLPVCAAGDYLLWQDYYDRAYSCDLRNGTLRQDVFSGLSCRLDPWAFSFRGLLYCTNEDDCICTYNPQTGCLTEVVQTEPADENSYPIYGCGAHLYYRSGDSVIRRDLETGAEQLMPDLRAVPFAETDSLLLVQDAADSFNSGNLLRYDLNGKAVQP